MKVLVIGAGPTGLTAALQLTASGVDCRIVERRTEPSTLSRAVGILPETIKRLQPLGAGETIVSEGMPIDKVKVTRAGKTLLSIDHVYSQSKGTGFTGLPQNRTEEILRDALHVRGVGVEYGIAAENVRTDDDSATVGLSDGTSERFDWVIGADGTRSIVREQLKIEYPGHDLPGKWSIADVDLTGDFDCQQVAITIQQPHNGFVMVLPIEKMRARVVSSTPDALAAMTEPLEIGTVRRTATFTISVRQAVTYDKGRVLLAGDAAHCHSPVGGKGMNLGIADAVAAANAIVDGTTGRYTAARHADGKSVIEASEASRKLLTSNNPALKVFSTLIMGSIGHLPFMRNIFIRQLVHL